VQAFKVRHRLEAFCAQKVGLVVLESGTLCFRCLSLRDSFGIGAPPKPSAGGNTYDELVQMRDDIFCEPGLPPYAVFMTRPPAPGPDLFESFRMVSAELTG